MEPEPTLDSLDEFFKDVFRRLVYQGHSAGSWKRFKILTIEQLLSRSASTSSIEERMARDAKYTQKKFSESPCSMVLAGKLSSTAQDDSLERYHLLPSELTFSDKTGKIPCFVSDVEGVVPSILNQTVIICQWNFIKSLHGPSGVDYLEIQHLVTLEDEPSEPQNLLTFWPSDVRFLQANRSVVGENLINVQGRVSAVCHPIRKTNHIIFLVKLKEPESDPDLDLQVIILSRNLKKICWHWFLTPGREYVFTKLQLTTMIRLDGRTEVLLITDESRSYLASDVSECLKKIDILVYLKDLGLDVKLFWDWKNMMFLEEENRPSLFDTEPKESNVSNVSGTITDISLLKFGIFELDGSIRMHLMKVSGVTSFRHLRVGTKVQLFNVHSVKSVQEKLSIYCCHFGCIRIKEFSSQLTAASSSDESEEMQQLLPAVQRITNNDSLAFADFERVLDAAKTFKEQFMPLLFVDFDAELFYDILCYASPKTNARISQRNRIPVLELISDDHSEGCVISPKSVDENAFALASIADVCNIFTNPADKMKRRIRAEDEEPGWRSEVISSEDITPKLILVAALKCSPSTARLQLFDQTGSIDCVVANALASSTDFDGLHQCFEGNCDEGRFPFSPSCPFPQTWSVGCLLRLDKFSIVKEVFDRDYFADQQETPLDRIYLEFSMTDLLCLRKFDFLHPSSAAIGHELEKKRKTESSVEDIANRCTCFVAHKFVLLHKELLEANLKSPPTVQMSFMLEVHLFGEVYTFNCGCRANVTQQLTANNFEQGRGAFLHFTKKSVCWYPVLNVGGVYCITVYGENDRKLFDGDPKERRRVYRQKIAFSSGVELRRIFPIEVDSAVTGQESRWSDKLKVTDFEKTIVEPVLEKLKKRHGARFSDETIVTSDENRLKPVSSFMGIIITRSLKVNRMVRSSHFRTHMTEATLNPIGIGIPGNLSLWLLIKNLTSPDEYSVYINFTNKQYALGFFAGSVVLLDRMQRRTSEAQRVYYRFLNISSCTLLSLSRIKRRDVSCVPGGISALDPATTSRTFHEEKRYTYLRDIWSARSFPGVVYVLCHINRVVRLTLEFSCILHLGVKVDKEGFCQRCNRLTIFKSKAQFRVDDGTGVAFVNCQGNQVAQLLSMSEAEWEELKSLAGSEGGAYYDDSLYDAESANSVECLIHVLCRSSSVRKSIVLEARPYRMFTNGAGPQHATIHEFQLEDLQKHERTFRSGATLETIRLPSLQMEFISMLEASNVKLTGNQLMTLPRNSLGKNFL